MLTPVLLLYLLLRSRKDKAYRQRFAERFALTLPATNAKAGIVLHAVSVGEFNAAKPLIKALLQQYPQLPLTITCTTPTASAAIVAFQAGQQALGKNVTHCYLPFDYPLLMRRWLNRLQPQLLIILETELWPNLLTNCRALAIPTLVVNARLSARSAKGYRRFSALSKPMLQQISHILTQDKASARRFNALGGRHVSVAGNVKFELDIADSSRQLAAQLQPSLQGRVVWVAGSTHAGEDELLIQAYQKLKPQFAQLLLVLAPRHPERFDAVAQLLEQQGVNYVRRSSARAPDAETAVWLADSMGELLSWYQLADVVFIGGSLIERGGHNPLEAMAFAKAVMAGPHVFNFQQVFNQLGKLQAYMPVSNADNLASAVQQLLQQPELAQQLGNKGLALYLSQQGAVSRIMCQADALLPLANISITSSANAVLWHDPAFFPQFEPAYFEAQYWQQHNQVTGHSTGRNTVWFIQQQDNHAVLRHYYRGGLVGKLNKDTFWPEAVPVSRAMAEFRLLSQMRHWGLPVPRPCAARYQKRSFGYSADILIERINGATDLAQLLKQQALTPEQWQQVGALIARFHQYGVFHSDLNCHNILLDSDGKLWLIDFDKCAIRQAGDWQQQNLQRLHRSLEKELRLHPGFHWQNEYWQRVLLGYNAHFNG